MPVFNAARAASLATLAVVSLTIGACGSGGAPSTQAPVATSLAAPSTQAAEAAIRRASDPGDAVDRVPGEFRLGPGNQQPPGVVVPLAGSQTSSDPMPGEFRLGPGNAQPPGVLVPLD